MRHIVAAFGLVAGLLFLAAQTFTPGTPVHTHTSAAQGGATLTSPTISAPVFSGTATGTYTLGGTPTLTSPTINTPTITTPTITGTTTAAAIATSGTFSSTKACATGFTRVTPNYCRVNDNNNVADGWADAIACTVRSPVNVTLPADANAALISFTWNGLSNNATALRTNAVTFFSTAACTAGTDVVYNQFDFREEVAIVAGSSIHKVTLQLIVPVTGTNTMHTTQSNAGGNGNADILGWAVDGYFD